MAESEDEKPRRKKESVRDVFRYLRIVAYGAGGWLIAKESTPGLLGIACVWWGIGSVVLGLVFEYIWAGPFNIITGRHRARKNAD